MGVIPRLARAEGPSVEIETLLRSQRGLITRRQTLTCGWNDAMIHHQVRTGRWRRVLPAVYAGFTGELTLEQRRAASFLYAGTDSQITGIAALRWHGLRYVPNGLQIHMLVPHSTQRTSCDFVRLQRTRRLDETA